MLRVLLDHPLFPESFRSGRTAKLSCLLVSFFLGSMYSSLPAKFRRIGSILRLQSCPFGPPGLELTPRSSPVVSPVRYVVAPGCQGGDVPLCMDCMHSAFRTSA